MGTFLRTSFLFFRTHGLRTFRGKRALICILLAAVPVVIAHVLARFAPIGPAPIATNLGWMLLLQIIVPILGLIIGSAVVAEEIEDRTITYLFSRPIPRASLLVGRYMAAVLFLSVLLALATVLLLHAAGGAQGRGAALDDSITFPLFQAAVIGGAVYAALFAALGVFFKHPMIVGLGYTFAIEGFLSNLPGKNQTLTIQYHLRSLIASVDSAHWRAIEGFDLTRFESAQSAWTALVVTLVVALGSAAWRISRREFVLTS
jgi:ABC-2 type transport system permease protein